MGLKILILFDFVTRFRSHFNELLTRIYYYKFIVRKSASCWR